MSRIVSVTIALGKQRDFLGKKLEVFSGVALE